ncbi:hypothetical protein [Enterobacter phage vB_ExiM_F5M1E]|nr:hypothetical protein [Enterobacter phage vB_ExiM_F1M1E]UNA03217.1 hypothetical protein [Enterobacter phage vB_ExiM_F2M1E]UNA03537.1 hypothetical protein [Enterobacter phage vB_ExiM_F4M1E]UNA03858.1 hypothetical protein [Enterobacter phage vB_ExiM_F5M1E]UNA04178.1 hypothetical protein [Pantoea phage vB_PdiM_F5M2A]
MKRINYKINKTVARRASVARFYLYYCLVCLLRNIPPVDISVGMWNTGNVLAEGG